MVKKTYGFAIVGSGSIGTFHAEMLQQVEDARLVAICDRNEDRVRKLAERFECKAYTDLNDMIADPDIDIVNLCSPSSVHGEQAIACARGGKHVIIEKPIDISLAKAKQVIESFRSSGTKLSVISQHRMDASIVKVKRLIDTGAFGKIVLGTGSVNWYRPQHYYDGSSWRGSKERGGGGALLNQGIHTIDMLQYLMGPVESVYSHCDTLGHERIDVEDVAAAALRFRSGAVGTLTATTSAYPGLSTRIEIMGTMGSAVIESDVLVYCKYRDPQHADEVIVDESDNGADELHGKGAADPMSISGLAHQLQFQDMITSVEENREPVVNGIEGIKPLEIVLAIYESSRIGKSVVIN